MHKTYYAYIMSSLFDTVLCIGVTGDLERRASEHRSSLHPNSFCYRYNCRKLVYYEAFSNIEEAIQRDTQLKKWKRERKDRLIDRVNSFRVDLLPDE